MKETGERDYSFPFTKARFGGIGGLPFGANGSNKPGGNGSRKNSDRRNPDYPGNQENIKTVLEDHLMGKIQMMMIMETLEMIVTKMMMPQM